MVRFLIVDDDPACRRLFKLFLAPYGQCDLAYDGHEAIGAFRMALDNQSPYDLVCLDIMMPDTDGHHVLHAIREMEQERGIGGSNCVKVIMTTATKDSKHCLQAFREGCEAYLTKPIDEQRLLAEVRHLLGKLPTASTRQAKSPSDPVPQATVSDAPAGPARRGRYLIVDDDAVCRELLRDILSVYGECDFAYDGAEAIDAVRLAVEDGETYDLVCLDIMMPGANGHDALQAIRQIEAKRGIRGSDGCKVVMTTALRDPKHCIEAFREGCESYVTKPIREEALLAAIRDLGLPLASPAAR